MRTGRADGAELTASSASTPLGRWAERHALLIDVVVATAVFLYDGMYLTSQYLGFDDLSLPAFLVAAVLSVSLCVAYILRRRSPRVLAMIIFAAAYGYLLLGVGLSPGPLVISGLTLYFLGTRCDLKVVVPAVLVVAGWVVVAAQPLLRKDYLRIGEVGVLVLTAVFVATVGLFARSRRHHVERLRDLNHQLARERDARAAIAAAEERSRIAREIHDIVSHSLGTMVVMADGAAHTVDSEPERAGQAMAQVRDTGRGAMAEMRRMLDVLRDDNGAPRAPQPGLAQLDRLLEETRATGLRVDLVVTGAPPRPGDRGTFPAGVDLAAYRIVQEALTNARRHGGPLLSVVTVTLAHQDHQIELRIVDDGSSVGARTDQGTQPTPGHGLVGMQERVNAYGGSLETGPLPDGGFAVHAVLPTGGVR